jgi:hypothetical protein
MTEMPQFYFFGTFVRGNFFGTLFVTARSSRFQFARRSLLGTLFVTARSFQFQSGSI